MRDTSPKWGKTDIFLRQIGALSARRFLYIVVFVSVSNSGTNPAKD